MYDFLWAFATFLVVALSMLFAFLLPAVATMWLDPYKRKPSAFVRVVGAVLAGAVLFGWIAALT